MKDSFLLYTKYRKQIKGLSMEQRGILFTAILMHEANEDVPEMDGFTQMAFDFICTDLDENRQKYEERCLQNSENGSKGGRPKKTEEKQTVSKKATETEKSERFSKKRTQAKKADNDNDFDNDFKEKGILTDTEKEKSGKPDLMPTVNAVIKYLNDKAGLHYRLNNKQTIDKIKARLNEGYTQDDFFRVIDHKVADWKGTDMARYIRPETLFGAKMESYLNEPAKPPNNRFGDFQQRDSQEHRDAVAKIIAMNAGG